MSQHSPGIGRRSRRWTTAGLLTGLATTTLGLTACQTSPLYRTTELELRDQVLSSYRQRLQQAGAAPRIELQRQPSEVEAELSDERKEELDAMAGPEAYAGINPGLGPGLLDAQPPSPQAESDPALNLSLQEAVRQAVAANLDLEVARLNPKIAESTIRQAEGRFDFVVFANADYQNLDTPQPAGTIPGLSSDIQSEDLTLTTGIRKTFTTGGSAEVSTGVNFNERNPSFFSVGDFWDADLGLNLSQPLLRNAGRRVNLAEIELAKDAKASAARELKTDVLDTVRDVEQGYWDLYLSRWTLLIRERQLERTGRLRDTLVKRADFDVPPASITDANARVEQRRADIIRARQNIRQSSDVLKRLINSDALPVSGESVLRATDEPATEPAAFSLLDSVSTALRYRPELQQALLAIRSADLRQLVADNAALPLLTLNAGINYNGLDVDDAASAYGDIFENEAIDYLVSGQFEYPLGNNAAEGLVQQRRFEREQATAAYRQASQIVVLDVKNAIRSVKTSYELIGATRAARRSAADAYRALLVEEEAGGALTPDFIDRQLNRLDQLAQAEIAEFQALRDYNVDLANYYRAMGTLLDIHGIVFDTAE